MMCICLAKSPASVHTTAEAELTLIKIADTTIKILNIFLFNIYFITYTSYLHGFYSLNTYAFTFSFSLTLTINDYYLIKITISRHYFKNNIYYKVIIYNYLLL